MDATYQAGDEVIWTGLARKFERRVRVVAARQSFLTAGVVYDIHDPHVIKGTIYSIPAVQLHAASEDGQP